MTVIFLFFTLFFSCSLFPEDDIIGSTDNENVGKLSGKLVLSGHEAAVGAQVVLVLQDNSTGSLSKAPGNQVTFTVVTGPDGKYVFKDIEYANYDLLAYFEDEKSHDSLHFAQLSIEFKDDQDLGEGVLRRPGSVKIQVLSGSIPVPGAECFIPGKSYSARADDSGFCIIKYIPQGKWNVSFRKDRFLSGFISDVPVVSGETVNIEPVKIEADPSEAPPAPGNLSSVYNADSGIVYLSWDTAWVTDMAGYIIYRKSKGAKTDVSGIITQELLQANSYSDSVLQENLDADTIILEYTIRSVDSDSNYSAYASFPSVTFTPVHRPVSPMPENGSLQTPLSPFLTWKPLRSNNGISFTYSVLFGTHPDSMELVVVGRSLAYVQLSNLDDGETFFWQVIARASEEIISGPIWFFTTRKSQQDNNYPLVPAHPLPIDAATGQQVSNLRLSWVGGDNDVDDEVFYDIYLGTDNPPKSKVAMGVTDSFFVITGLQNSITYYWNVTASDGKASRTGAVWSFTTMSIGNGNRAPEKPYNPSPADSALNLNLSVELSWLNGDPDGDDVYYDLFLGTDPRSLRKEAAGISAASYLLTGLSEDLVYYWKVVASDGQANTSGDVWTFTTKKAASNNNPPIVPHSPLPEDSARDRRISLSLSWSGGDPDQGDELTYDVYLGTGNPPETRVEAGLENATYDLSNLEAGRRYYWYVKSSDGQSTVQSQVWTFITREPDPLNNLPLKPLLISPVDDSSGLDVSVRLTWSCEDPDMADEVTSDVYLSTRNPPVDKVATASAENNYAGPGGLAYATLYYWRVVCSDGASATQGDIWSFRTKEEPVPYEAPHTPANPTPVDGADKQPVSMMLQWEGGSSNETVEIIYDIYISTTSPPEEKFTSVHNTTSLQLDSLEAGLDYFWKIVARVGDSSSAGPIWTFSTVEPANIPPQKPVLLSPENTITLPDTFLTLSWQGRDPDEGDSLFYRVLFGESNPPVTIIADSLSENTMSMSGLRYNVTYYWQVFASDGDTSVSADVWSFRIGEGPGNLVAFYPFNGNADDESDNSNDGNVRGADLIEDRFGNENKAYEFDGNADYINLGDDNSLVPNSISLSIWIKPLSYPEGNSFAEIIRKHESYALTLSGNGNPLYPSAMTVGIAAPTQGNFSVHLIPFSVLPLNEWTNIIMTKDESLMKVYVNGEQYGTDTACTGDIYIEDRNSTLLGTWGYSDRASVNRQYRDYHGALDDLRIYDYALNEAQIKLLYREGGWGE
ncbi:MAG: hypothetical protein HQK83_10605 [Fibrobacteria bacterium]|nr:hypothetical protein [Fibrobacteria bacterium]